MPPDEYVKPVGYPVLKGITNQDLLTYTGELKASLDSANSNLNELDKWATERKKQNKK